MAIRDGRHAALALRCPRVAGTLPGMLKLRLILPILLAPLALAAPAHAASRCLTATGVPGTPFLTMRLCTNYDGHLLNGVADVAMPGNLNTNAGGATVWLEQCAGFDIRCSELAGTRRTKAWTAPFHEFLPTPLIVPARSHYTRACAILTDTSASRGPFCAPPFAVG
jgi:hypothetical protein